MNAPPAAHKALRLALLALVLAAPAAGAAGLLQFCGYSLKDYVPGYPNDETHYYLQVQAFATHGFSTGYFGLEEHAAPASFSRFGYHGPIFPILYGFLARPFGVWYGMACYLNVGVMTAALAGYLWLTRPTNGTLALIAALLLTYWPFYATVFSWMQEPLQCAISVLLAGLFTALLRDPPPARRRVLFAATLLTLCCAALLRVSWALLLPPAYLLGLGARTPRAKVLALALSGVTVLACMKGFQVVCAPFVSESWPAFSQTSFLMNKLVTGEFSLSLLYGHFLKNFPDFLDYFRIGHVLIELILLQNLMLLGILAAVQGWREVSVLVGKRPAEAARPAGGWLALVAYNQLVIVASTMFVYVIRNEGGPRLFGIHLLLGLLVAANAPRPSLRALVPAALALNVILGPATATFLRDKYYFYPRFHERPAVEACREGMARVLAFDPSADAWANTILSDRVPMEFAGLPAGMGFQYYIDPKFLEGPVRSRYIIAPPYEIAHYRGKVKYLATLPVPGGKMGIARGTDFPNLYLNLDPAPPKPRPGSAATPSH
jgi:hypothetical protein